MDVVSIDGEQVPLALLRAGLKNEVQSFVTLLLDITGETKIPDWISVDPPIADKPREDTPGYSFLDDERFSDVHLGLLKRLVEDPKWRIGVLDNEGRWMWNVPAVLRFFSHTGKMQESLMPVKQVACSKRGTELGDTKIRNTRSRRRNLDIQLGKVLYSSCYTKTSELTGQDSYLPTQLPTEISRPLVHYLAVVRPVECILSRVVWGEDAAALYRSYLFVSRGRLLTSEENSEYLGRFFRSSCNADIRLNRCRQLSSTFTREFIDERLLPRANRRSDLGMGHSGTVTRRHYSQDHAMLEFLTSDALYEQCWVDGQYHALLGFGSEPPPVALRLRGLPTQQHLSAAIKLPLQDVLQELVEGLKQTLVEDVVGGLRVAIQTEVQAMLQALAGASQHSAVPEPETSMGAEQQRFAPSGLTAFLPPRIAAPSWNDRGVNMSSSLVPDSDPPLLDVGEGRNPWAALVRPREHGQPPHRAKLSSSPVPDSDPPPQPSNQLYSQSPSLPESFSEIMHNIGPNPPRNHFYNKLLSISQTSATAEMDWETSDSDDFLALSEISSLAKPSSPIRKESGEVRERALAAFCRLYGKNARPKSQAQLDLCEAAIAKEHNVVAVLPTGAGKSAAWLICAVVLPEVTTVVVVPYKELLTQHLNKALELNIQAQQWTAATGNQVPEDVNLLFVACESAKSHTFHR
jgi:hypothetical protein